MAQRICLFPGTFDPITKGHTDIIDRALGLFDSLIIGIGINSSKQPMFSIEQRIEWIERIYKNEPKIKVIAYEGLTIDCCKNNNAQFILRGIRYINDFEYEKAIADKSGYGEIICHCERATRQEVLDALESPLPPTTLGGLGRRTRAGLGRCQGFYCHSELRKLLEKK